MIDPSANYDRYEIEEERRYQWEAENRPCKSCPSYETAPDYDGTIPEELPDGYGLCLMHDIIISGDVTPESMDCDRYGCYPKL